MDVKEKLKDAYYQHLLHFGEQPKSVYLFAKENEVAEEEFYRHFGAFESIEQELWKDFLDKVIVEVQQQEVWGHYTSREKALSVFYSFIELLKSKRSFATYSLRHAKETVGPRRVLELMKNSFEVFSTTIIQEGIESGELMDRPFFAARYKDALWLQLGFVLNFWLRDTSAGFDKTDEAIEKGVNVTYNMFQRSPIDELFEYGKFLAKNSGVKMPF